MKAAAGGLAGDAISADAVAGGISFASPFGFNCSTFAIFSFRDVGHAP